MSQQEDRTAYLPYAPAPDPTEGPRPLAAILGDLRRPIHEKYLQTKSKKGTEITFISWHTAVRILDRYAPGWQYPAPQVSIAGGQVVVSVQIGIPTSDQGLVWRGATGWDEDEDKAYGDASDRAESQAFRRACAKFGLALYLYYEKGANGPTQRGARTGTQAQTAIQAESSAPSSSAPPSVASGATTARPSAPSEPPADLSDKAMATDQQIFTIRGLTPKAGLTPDGLLQSLEVQTLSALTHERARKVIERLTAKAKERGQVAS